MPSCKISLRTQFDKDLDITEDDFNSMMEALNMGCEVSIIDKSNRRYARVKNYEEGKIAIEVNDDWGDIDEINYKMKDGGVIINDMEDFEKRIPRIRNGYGISVDATTEIKRDYSAFKKNLMELNERASENAKTKWRSLQKRREIHE